MESGDDDEFHAKRSRFIDNIMTTTGGEMKQASSVQMSPSTIIYNEREIDDTLITQRNDEDDAFFEHTKRDAIILQQSLSSTRARLTNRPMVSAQVVLEQNQLLRARAWAHSVIRIMLPQSFTAEQSSVSDAVETSRPQFIVQMCLDSSTKISEMYAQVGELLSLKCDDFILVRPPSQLVPMNDQTILDSSLAPAARLVMRMKISVKKPLIPTTPVTARTEAETTATNWRSANSKYEKFEPLLNDNAQDLLPKIDDKNGSSKVGPIQSTGPRPKWLSKK